MPLDTEGLTRLDKLGPETFPGFDEDEYINMRVMRNAIDDYRVDVDIKKPRRKPVVSDEMQEGEILGEGQEDPDVEAAESQAEGTVASEFDTDFIDEMYGIFGYMVPSFHIFKVPSPVDLKKGRTRGRLLNDKSSTDRWDVFVLLAKPLIDLFQARAGNLPAEKAKVGPDGKPVTFPAGDTVGDTEPKAEVQNTEV